MMLFGFLLIGLVIYMLFAQSTGNVKADHSKDPLDVAKMRLARGEITIEEYEKVKKIIVGLF